jgi:hypothetical protein
MSTQVERELFVPEHEALCFRFGPSANCSAVIAMFSGTQLSVRPKEIYTAIYIKSRGQRTYVGSVLVSL